LFFYSSWFSKKGFIEILDKIYDLTERENEVIYYAIMGYTLKQTADEMKIAFNTARNESTKPILLKTKLTI
jgi:DNA-binding NarL/FixJ family response regulator